MRPLLPTQCMWSNIFYSLQVPMEPICSSITYRKNSVTMTWCRCSRHLVLSYPPRFSSTNKPTSANVLVRPSIKLFKNNQNRISVIVLSDWQWPRPRPRPTTSIQNSMGICVVICLCAVWTTLYNSTEPNVIGLGLGLGLAHCQCDNTITVITPITFVLIN